MSATGQGPVGQQSRRARRELGEEMHIHKAWAGCFGPCGWSCSLGTAWFSAGWGLGEMQNSSPRADLVLRCSLAPCGLQGWFCEECPWLGPCVLPWPAESEPLSPFAGSCSFLPATAEPSGASVGSPGAALSTLAPSQECVRWAGPGDRHPKKGKSCLLVFLLQPLSHLSGWERQGPVRLKVTSFCCWPWASERESERERHNNTDVKHRIPSLHTREAVREHWEGLAEQD